MTLLLTTMAILLCLLFGYAAYLLIQLRGHVLSERNMAEALDHIAVAIYIKDCDRRFVYANRATSALLKSDANSLLGALEESHLPPDQAQRVLESDDRVLRRGESTRGEFVIEAERGLQQAFLEFKHPLRDKRGRVVGLVGLSTDVSELHRLQRELEHAARIDELTGVYNRRALFEYAEQDFAHSRRHGRPFSLLIIDIDRFKQINDTYGHPVGDRIIRSVADQTRLAVREVDRLGRIGGEEFVVLLPETDVEQAAEIAERVRLAAMKPTELQSGVSLKPTVSIGVASLFPEDRAVHDLYQRADEALYRAKEGGRNKVEKQPPRDHA